jgi:hypothetical protein
LASQSGNRNTEPLGFNYRGTAWSDGQPIARADMPDGTSAEAIASLGYTYDPDTETWVPGGANTIPNFVEAGSGQVTAAGTPVQLPQMQIASVTVKARKANTGYLYVGGSNVSSSRGFELGAGDAVSTDIDDLSKVWVDASVAAQQFSWIIVASVTTP